MLPSTARLLGGRVGGEQLRELSDLSWEYGDGELHLTDRGSLVARGLPLGLAYDVLVSPLTGLEGGRLDAWPIARELDRLLLADPRLARLPEDFLFVIDDGRGDLIGRASDLAAVALDATSVQVRVGSVWGEATSAANAARLLVVLAQELLANPDVPPMPAYRPDPRLPAPIPPLPYDARHVAVPDGILGRDQALALARHPELVVTPWRGVLLR